MIRTSYDYDAAINEFGLINLEKYNASKALHSWLTYYSDAILAANTIPPLIALGNLLEGNDYGAVIFLANINTYNATVNWPINSTNTYYLPAWSVSFVDGNTGKMVFNTATGPFTVDDNDKPIISTEAPMIVAEGDSKYQCYPDVFGLWDIPKNVIISPNHPFEQINMTHDSTDYLLYATNVTLTPTHIKQGYVAISIKYPGDYLYIAIRQPSMTSSLRGNLSHINVLTQGVSNNIAMNISLTSSLIAGPALLVFLSQTMGLQHLAANQEQWTRGFQSDSSIIYDGKDVTNNIWYHVIGLFGEALKIPNWKSSDLAWSNTSFCQSHYSQSPIIWYRLDLNISLKHDGNEARYAIDMISMWKGAVWVNGNHIGRYYLILAEGEPNQGDCIPCDYRGSYSYKKCSRGCGQPTQRYYHIPRGYLIEGINHITILEESPLQTVNAPAQVNIVRMN